MNTINLRKIVNDCYILCVDEWSLEFSGIRLMLNVIDELSLDAYISYGEAIQHEIASCKRIFINRMTKTENDNEFYFYAGVVHKLQLLFEACDLEILRVKLLNVGVAYDK